ncbi:MAG: ABC transporter ATP-binding protein [Thermoplasmatota archaeon]
MEEDNPNIIELEGFTKFYGSLKAIDSIDLHIPFGPVGLLGPNGAGKSTLIKCLLGLIDISSGDARIFGTDMNETQKILDVRRSIGYMPESDCLIPEMDAISFVSFMGELSGLPAMDSMQRAHEVLHYVGIGDERYRKIKTYSTGMKQKVKLAQAVVHDPKLVFLDEPTNGMDPKGREEMLDLVLDISRNHGKNVIFSSHLLPDVEYICDHVIIMNQGRILKQGYLRDLTRSLDRFEIRIKGDQDQFASILNDLKLDYEISGSYFRVRSEENQLNRIYEAIRGTPIEIRKASRSGRSLEEIFLSEIKGAGGGPS